MPHTLVVRPRDREVVILEQLALDTSVPYLVTDIRVKSLRFKNGSAKKLDAKLQIVPGVVNNVFSVEGFTLSFNAMLGTLTIVEHPELLKDVVCSISVSADIV